MLVFFFPWTYQKNENEKEEVMNDHPRYTMQYIMKSILIPLVLCMILQDIRTAQATLTNQCTNDDVKNWIDHNYAKFASSMNTCAVKSLSIDSLALKSLKEYMPDATDSCLGCAVGLFNCISAYCVNSCISLSAVQGANYFTTKCLECLRDGNTAQYNCIADSNSCSGWIEDFVFNCETCKQSSDDIFYGIDDNIVWDLIGGIPCFFILVAIISCCYFKRYAKHAELGDQPLPPLKPGETRQPHTAFFNMFPIFHPFSHTVGAPIGPPPGLESIGASSHSFSSSDLNGNKSFIGILDEHSSTSSMMQPQAYMMQSGQLFQQLHL